MPKEFKGELLHALKLFQNFIDASTATGTTEAQNYEFEVMDAAILLACKNMLPILKSIKCYIVVNKLSGFDLGNGAGVIVEVLFWNRDSDAIPEARQEGIFSFECFGSAFLNIFDVEISTPLQLRVRTIELQRNFGIDGIMLRPRISAEAIIRNSSGSSIPADSFTMHIEPVIDFVPVSEDEFEDYLRELYLFNAIVNE